MRSSVRPSRVTKISTISVRLKRSMAPPFATTTSSAPAVITRSPEVRRSLCSYRIAPSVSTNGRLNLHTRERKNISCLSVGSIWGLSEKKPVRAQVANQHDVERLAWMMSKDHAFIDSLGQVVRGRDKVRAAWIGYFA